MALTVLMFAAFLFQAPAAPAADLETLELAYILEDIAVAQRTQGNAERALDFFEMAVEIRRSFPQSPRVEFARGLTAVAMLRLKIHGLENAIEGLQRAIEEWDAAAPGDPLALRPLEALAAPSRSVILPARRTRSWTPCSASAPRSCAFWSAPPRPTRWKRGSATPSFAEPAARAGAHPL